MKLNASLKLRKLGNRYFIVDNKQREVNLTDIYELNDTAVFLWKKVQNGSFTVKQLVRYLCDEYGIDEMTALKDVNALLDEWLDWNIIEIENGKV